MSFYLMCNKSPAPQILKKNLMPHTSRARSTQPYTIHLHQLRMSYFLICYETPDRQSLNKIMRRIPVRHAQVSRTLFTCTS